MFSWLKLRFGRPTCDRCAARAVYVATGKRTAAASVQSLWRCAEHTWVCEQIVREWYSSRVHRLTAA